MNNNHTNEDIQKCIQKCMYLINIKKITEYCENSIFPNRMGEWKDWQAQF